MVLREAHTLLSASSKPRYYEISEIQQAMRFLHAAAARELHGAEHGV